MFLIWSHQEVKILYTQKNELKWKIITTKHNLGVHGVSNDDIPDDASAIIDMAIKYIHTDHREDVYIDRFVNGKSEEVIAVERHRSKQTIRNWISSFIEEVAFRSYPLFVEKGNFTEDSYIRSFFCFSLNEIRRLEKEGTISVKDLKSRYWGCSDREIKIKSSNLKASSRRYIMALCGGSVSPEENTKFEKGDSVDLSKPLFLVLKEFKSRYYGINVNNSGLMRTTYLDKNRSFQYSLISVEDKIKPAMMGDCSISSFECIPKIAYSHIKEKGIDKLSDFLNYTLDEVQGIKYLGVSSIQSIEEELIYRFGKGYKVPVPKVTKETQEAIKEKTGKDYISVEEYNEMPLPNGFLIYLDGKCKGTTSDSDILEMYLDYLETSNREDDWLVLRNLMDSLSTLPVGIIHLMEKVKNGVFPCGILADRYGFQLLEEKASILSEDFSKIQKLALKSLYTNLLVNEDINILDLVKFCSNIDFVISVNKLSYLYKNYRNDGMVFTKRPIGVEKLEENGETFLRGYFKGTLSDNEVNLVCRFAKNYNLSYKYIIDKVDYYLNNRKSIGGSMSLLVSWFVFNPKAMKLYLVENPNFGKMEV